MRKLHNTAERSNLWEDVDVVLGMGKKTAILV